MRVNLAVTGPGPLWATADPAAGNQRLKPRPDLFGRYARAVALRYGARRRPLHRLERAEPAAVAAAAVHMRGPDVLALRLRTSTGGWPARPWAAIHGADPVSQVLIGALAPRGQNPRARNAAMRPLSFLRAMGCVGSRLPARAQRPVLRL